MVKFDVDIQDGSVDVPTMKLEKGHLVPDYVTTYECKELIVNTDDVLDVEKGEYIASEIYDDLHDLFGENKYVKVRVYFNKGYFQFLVGREYKIEDVKRCFKREIRSLENTRMIENVISKRNNIKR